VTPSALTVVVVGMRCTKFTGAFWRTLQKMVRTDLMMSTTDRPQTDGGARSSWAMRPRSRSSIEIAASTPSPRGATLWLKFVVPRAGISIVPESVLFRMRINVNATISLMDSRRGSFASVNLRSPTGYPKYWSNCARPAVLINDLDHDEWDCYSDCKSEPVDRIILP